MDTIALRAVAARRFAKLTQKQAEAASGVKQSDISKIERGDTERPAGLLALARAYKVDPHWLDTGDGVPPWEEGRAASAATESSSGTAGARDIRALVEQVAALSKPERPALRKTLAELIGELIMNPGDPVMLEQTLKDINRIFGQPKS